MVYLCRYKLHENVLHTRTEDQPCLPSNAKVKAGRKLKKRGIEKKKFCIPELLV